MNEPRAPHERRGALFAALFALACALIGFALGDSYISRLPHHAGYFLVPTTDAVRVPIPVRPRHTVLVVVDGLRRDFAESMRSAKRISDRGQCRISDQGDYTVSRPEYALLSTGLEVDRTGARNNECSLPLAAESIWQVARESGLSVAGSSHLPWFRELFPSGFDRFRVARSHEENIFDVKELADLNVFHPLYVDEAAHQHGTLGADYADAVARADRELGELLDRLDLDRDVVVLTADHGHRDAGGHGGSQPEIRQVLACFAGPNVVRADGRARFDARTTAPLLSVLLGVRLPRHLRAGEDDLDSIGEIARFGPAGDAYEKDRRRAIASAREENGRALSAWLGGDPARAPEGGEAATWTRLYARESAAQSLRTAVIAAALALLTALRLRRTKRLHGARAVAHTAAWLVWVFVTVWAAHRLVLGDFDFTVINLKATFVPRAFLVIGVAMTASVGAHALGGRRLARLARLRDDLVTVLLLLLVMHLGHIFVYGWPLGFPLPGPVARYWPFFGSIALVGAAVVTLVTSLVSAAYGARSGGK